MGARFEEDFLHFLIGEARVGEWRWIAIFLKGGWHDGCIRDEENFTVDRIIHDLATRGDDDFANEFFARGDEAWEVIRREFKLARAIEFFFEACGKLIVANCGKDDARGRRWIAVGIKSAAAGNLDCFVEVAMAPEDTEDDLCAVEGGFDDVGQFGAGAFVAIGLIDFEPGLFPVVGVFGVPLEEVADHLGVAALFGDGHECSFDDFDEVRFKKCRGIEGADELAAEFAVRIIHDAAEFFAHEDGLLRHARSDDARVVRFDLVVDIVGAFVDAWVGAIGRCDAFAQAVAAFGVGVPEAVLGVGEVDGGAALRDVVAVLLHRMEEGHFDVDVVLIEGVVDHVRCPGFPVGGGHNLVLILEFGGCAPGDARDLADPGGFHFVAINAHGKTAHIGVVFWRKSATRRKKHSRGTNFDN